MNNANYDFTKDDTLIFPIIVKVFDSNDNFDVQSIDITKVIMMAIIATTILPNILEIEFFVAFRETQYYVILNENLNLLPGFLSGYVFAKYDLFKKYNYLLRNKLINTIISIFGILAVELD